MNGFAVANDADLSQMYTFVTINGANNVCGYKGT